MTQHPGTYRKEWLQANNKSQNELASAMQVRPPFMSKIVNGHAHITPKVALKLEAATGVNASTWASYEMEYSLSRARGEVAY